MRNHTFRLLQFHYGDESCTLALYTLTARGRYRLRGRSWVTPGATEAEYTLTRVTVTAHSAEVAEELAARVNTTCPGQVRRRWKPYRDYVVLSLPEELALSDNQPPSASSSYQRRNAASSSALGEELADHTLRLSSIAQSAKGWTTRIRFPTGAKNFSLPPDPDQLNKANLSRTYTHLFSVKTKDHCIFTSTSPYVFRLW
jgi:hypothetical protein